eukprot:125302_1
MDKKRLTQTEPNDDNNDDILDENDEELLYALQMSMREENDTYNDVQDNANISNMNNEENDKCNDVQDNATEDSSIRLFSQLCAANPNNLEYRLEYAKQLYLAENFHAAELQYIKCLDIHHNYSLALYGLMFIYEQQEQWNKAVVYSKKLVDMFPQDPEANYSYARHMCRLTNYDIALKYVKTAKALDPNDAKYHNLHFCILMNSDKKKEAEIVLQMTVSKFDDPEDIVMYFFTLTENKSVEKGIEFWNSLNTKQQLNHKLRNGYRAFLNGVGLYEEASKQAEQTYQLSPDENYGRIWVETLMTHDKQKALSICNQLVEIYAQKPWIYYLKAEILSLQYKDTEAVFFYKQAYHLSENKNVQYGAEYADCLTRLKQHEQAQQIMTPLLAKHENDMYWYILCIQSRILWRNKKYLQAEKCLQQIQSDSGNLDKKKSRLLCFGQLYLEWKQYAKSVKYFEKYMTLCSNVSAGAHLLYGRALHGMKQINQAQIQYMKSLERNKGSAKCHYHFSILLMEELQLPTKAIIHLQRAVELWPDNDEYLNKLNEFYKLSEQIKTNKSLENVKQSKKMDEKNIKMDLRHNIKTFKVLNVDTNDSTIPMQNVLISRQINNGYIVSDVDEELLFLIEFQAIVDFKGITIYASEEN